MKLSTTYVVWCAIALLIGCNSSDSSTSNSTSAADAGAADMMAPTPAVDAGMSGGPECSDEGDNCPAACAYLADCSVTGDLCPGFNEDARDGIYAGCLESCAAIPAQAVLVCGHNSCEQTVSFATSADSGFRELCLAEPEEELINEFDGVYKLAEETWANCSAWAECENQEDIWYMVVDGRNVTWYNYLADACSEEPQECSQQGISGRIELTETGFNARGGNGGWSVDFTRRGDNGLASTFSNEGCEDSPWVYDYVSDDQSVIEPICVIRPGVGEPLPELVATDQSGDDFSLSSTLGSMALIIINGGEWCPPCRTFAAMSQGLLNEWEMADDRYSVRFVQLMIDNGTFGEAATQASTAQWAEAQGVTYPVLFGEGIEPYVNEHMAELITAGTFGVPSCWLVDPLGQIRDFGVCGQYVEGGITPVFETFLSENPEWMQAP